MGMDDALAKHYYYRIKREELALEEQKKIYEEQEAKRKVKKILKQIKLPMLEEAQDYEKYYSESKDEKAGEKKQIS